MEDLKNVLEENGVMCEEMTYSETLDKLVRTLKKDYIKREVIAIRIGLCVLAVSTLCAGIGFGSGRIVLSTISFIMMIVAMFQIIFMILHTKRKCEKRYEELGYDAKPNELNDGQYAKFWALAKKKFRLYDDDELLKKLTGDEEISFKSVQISDENEDEARKSVKEKYGEEAVKDFTFISTPLGMIAVGDGFLWEADIDDCEE